LLPTPGSFLGLAEGAWPPEVRAFLTTYVAHLEKPLLEALPRELQSAALLRVDPALMAELTELACRHAEPEIAIHLVAGSPEAVLLEWYDAPDDPVALAGTLDETIVASFAAATGGSYGRAKPGV
jgi:hypothetical protein